MTEQPTENETAQHVINELRDASWVMVTTMTEAGDLVSHPMVPQDVNDDGEAWFFTSKGAGQTDALRADSAVNISIAENGKWISIAGDVEFDDDPARFEDLWNDNAAAWFGDKGKDGAQLVKVVPSSAQMWGVPGNRVAAAVKMVASRIAGDKTKGHSDTVEL